MTYSPLPITHLDLPVQYSESDVVAAQRLRFRHSSRLKVLTVLGLLALLPPLAQRINPDLFGGAQADLSLLLAVAALFLLAPALTYLIGPFLDFRRKSFWHAALKLGINSSGLRLALADAPPDHPGIELGWDHLHHTLENEQVIILFFGHEEAFIVVPKRLLADPQQMAYFRGVAGTGPRGDVI